jgi:hypothetical protein
MLTCTIAQGALMITTVSQAIAVVIIMLFPILANAQERSIKRSDLPPTVENTVIKQSDGATIRGFSQEKENGQVFYEAELTVNGHSKDILMSADGEVVEVEEQAAIASLPPAVLDGLHVKARNGKLIKVETLTKKGRLVAYEAQVLTNGKKSEIQVGPDGRPLDHEE